MIKTAYSVAEFIDDCTAIVALGLDDPDTVGRIEPLLKKLIARHECLEDLGSDPFPQRRGK